MIYMTAQEYIEKYPSGLPADGIKADGSDYTITVPAGSEYLTYSLIGDADGSIKVDGDGDGNACRDGSGRGNAWRDGGGSGIAWCSGHVSGDAIRTGSGYGHAWRDGPGDGNAIRDGDGCNGPDHRNLARRTGRNEQMTGEEFRSARKKLGLTQVQMARILSTAPTTVRKWEADDSLSTSRRVNPIAARVMEWMLEGFQPPEM